MTSSFTVVAGVKLYSVAVFNELHQFCAVYTMWLSKSIELTKRNKNKKKGLVFSLVSTQLLQTSNSKSD